MSSISGGGSDKIRTLQCVLTPSLLSCYVTNSLLEFHQIYNLGAVETIMNRLDFEVKRSKVKVTARPRSNNNFGRHFLIFGMHRRICSTRL